nr:ribonuclease H-like domain-containing protein [Tanacetum cinerariifolium]
MMRQNKNLMDINIDALYNILKQNQQDVNDAMGSKKKTVVVTSDPLALIAEKTKVSKSKEKVVVSSDSEGREADDFSKLKKITVLLAKAFNRRKFYFKPTNNNLITSSSSQFVNKKQEFVKTDNKNVEKKDDEKKRDISRAKCYNCKKEGHFAKDCKKVKVKDYEYYKTKMLLAKKDKDEQVLLAEDQAWMESSSDSDQEINANMVFMAQIEKVLPDSEASSSSVDEKISEKRIEKANQQSKDFKIQNKDLQDKYNVLKNQTTTFEINNKELYEQLKELIEMNNDLLAQTKVLKKQLQVKHVVIDTHAECQEKYAKLEAERYDYMIRYSAYFDNDKQADQEVFENDCLVVEKECDKEENPKVIAPGMFKLSVSQCVSPISMSKTSCKSNNIESKLKRKRRKRKSSKQNVKQVDNDVLRANTDFVDFLDLGTFSSVRRPKNSGVIWKKKGSSNTSNDGLSAVSVSNLNKNVKRYSRKDLLSCNNSHIGETSSAYMCNDAMNVSCDSSMNDLLDDNNFFIFDDESVKIFPVSKMPFRKKPRDSMNIVQICLWIIDSGCSKHMTGNRALLTNFVEKFLETVRFGNNDFAVIAGYETWLLDL